MSELQSQQTPQQTASSKANSKGEQPEFSVVIPVYNEESIIVEAIEELVDELEHGDVHMKSSLQRTVPKTKRFL